MVPQLAWVTLNTRCGSKAKIHKIKSTLILISIYLISNHHHPTQTFRIEKTIQSHCSMAIDVSFPWPGNREGRRRPQLWGFCVVRIPFHTQNTNSSRKRMSTSWFNWLSLLIKNRLGYRVLRKGSTIFSHRLQPGKNIQKATKELVEL